MDEKFITSLKEVGSKNTGEGKTRNRINVPKKELDVYKCQSRLEVMETTGGSI
jgi:hypothetical protein